MSRCSCSGAGGGVAIEAGTNVTVEGSGSAANPYRISAKTLNLVADDTSTLDFTLTGAGTTLNPYSLSASLTPAAGFRLSEAESDWSGAVTLVNAGYDGPRTVRRRLTGNVTALTMPTWAANVAGEIILVLRQDGTGGRTWVQPGVSSYGYDIVLSTAANAIDIIQAIWDGSRWTFTPIAMQVS